MKKILILIVLGVIFFPKVNAQDIADVAVKARFERSKTIYLGGGPSFVQGALGDYGMGMSFETGFMKRLNKVMSIGGAISYLGFKYDASKTYPNYYDGISDQTIDLTLHGGDVSLLSAGVNFKLNLIPVSDDSKFSIYGIGTPFVSYYKRTEVSGNGDFYDWNAVSGNYDIFSSSDSWDVSGFPVLKAQSKLTGGVYLGFGAEFMPAKPISIFVQATYGYTFPISYVSTQSFLHDADINTTNTDLPAGVKYYNDDSNAAHSYFNSDFPIVKKGFTAVSLKLGVAFNF